MPATEAPEYPAWWDFDEDGEHIEGTFVRAGLGYTRMGERPFVVLDIEGTERTVWLHHEVLRSSFAREVQRRPDKAIHEGERVEVWRLGERRSANDFDYMNFRVEFADGPELSQADVFGLPPEGPAPSSEAPEAVVVVELSSTMTFRSDESEGRPRSGAASPTQAEIFAGLSQVEIFGPPSLGRPRSRHHPRQGMGMRMPDWYADRCEVWSKAVWHGQITEAEAAFLLDVWHPDRA